MRTTLHAAISMIAVALVLAACGGAPVSRTSASPASPAFDVSTTPAPASPAAATPSVSATPAAAATSAASPPPPSCATFYPLPDLCVGQVGRVPTAVEYAAMVAAGAPAVEKALGYKDWSVCTKGQTCFKFSTAASAMVGINAGVLDGGYGLYPEGGLGAACWVFVDQDSNGWHYVDSGCAQNSGFVPGSSASGAHVFVTGCANFRSAPGLSSKVLGCMGTGTTVDVDSAPAYVDGHIWWHLAGRGWMAHDYLCEICRV
jgi:hypothetical protein